MLKRYGEKALEESAARADELALAGDADGATVARDGRGKSSPPRRRIATGVRSAAVNGWGSFSGVIPDIDNDPSLIEPIIDAA
jgi:hypothetical protein